jgi:hypothetical protein
VAIELLAVELPRRSALTRSHTYSQSDVSQARWPKEKKLLPKRELPKPKYCDPYYCDADDPPACTDFEQNVHGKPGSGIMSADDTMNPFGPQQRKARDLAPWARTLDDHQPTTMMPRSGTVPY